MYAYPIRAAPPAVHIASSADSTPRSDAAAACRCIFVSQRDSCMCMFHAMHNATGSLRVTCMPSTGRAISHAESYILDSPKRVEYGPGRVETFPAVGDTCHHSVLQQSGPNRTSLPSSGILVTWPQFARRRALRMNSIDRFCAGQCNLEGCLRKQVMMLLLRTRAVILVMS